MISRDRKIDWSDKCFRDMLVYQRKSAIHEYGRDRIASFYGLHPGMTVMDVGCGLGFLGRNYWRYFGEGGHYIGVDVSPDLLERARKESSEWADGGEVSFTVGNAYDLPFADSITDAVMCQTLLMHLQDPVRALREMIRVVKPGGVVICQEPDNLTPQLKKRHWSLPDEMRQLQLIDVDVHTTEYVPHLHPPYAHEQEKVQLEMLQKQLLDKERRETLRAREREEFLAGGGTPEEWMLYCAYSDKLVAELRQQTRDGRYFYCGAYPHYYTRGTKPRN